MFMAADEFPLPYEYRFFQLDGLITVPPEDVDERTIVFLDCGNIDRNPADVLKRDGAHILNIDHHHDNTRFGTVNHVVPEASCTAEIVWDLMRALGVRAVARRSPRRSTSAWSPTRAASCTRTPGPRAHVMAAELIDAGVDVHEIYRRLYEGDPVRPSSSCSRAACANVERFDDGRLTLTRLTREDYAETAPRRPTPRASSTTCASVQGTAVAGARPRAARRRTRRAAAQGLAARHRRPRRRLGDRPRPGRRRPPPGGGLLHRDGAGDELVAFLRARGRRARRSSHGRAPRRRRPARRQARRQDLARHRRRGAPRAAGARRKVGHAGTLDPFATGLLLVLVGARDARPALPHGAAEDLRGRRAARGGRRRTGDPEGEIAETGAAIPPEPLVLPTGELTQRPPAYSAVKVGGERAYAARAARGRRSSCPSARSTVHRFERALARGRPRRFAIECSSGTYVR